VTLVWVPVANIAHVVLFFIAVKTDEFVLFTHV